MNIARINERINLYINLPLFLLVSMWFQSSCLSLSCQMTKWGCLRNQAQVQQGLFEALLLQHRLRFCLWKAKNMKASVKLVKILVSDIVRSRTSSRWYYHGTIMVAPITNIEIVNFYWTIPIVAVQSLEGHSVQVLQLSNFESWKVDFKKWMYLDSEFMASWIVIALCLWINTFYFICRSKIIKILSIRCCKIVETWWKPNKHFFFWWSKKWMTSLVMLFMV